MAAQLVLHGMQRRFGNGDFMPEDLDVVVVALIPSIAMLADEFSQIIGGFGIQAPQSITGGTGFGHDCILQEPAARICMLRHRSAPAALTTLYMPYGCLRV
jgi:hypothetical protein